MSLCYNLSMSSTLDRLRRLHDLRPQRNRSELEIPPALDPVTDLPVRGAARVEHDPSTRLEVLVPGELIENSAGICYVRTQAHALDTARGTRPLGDLLLQQPAIFAPFHPTFGLRAEIDFHQAAFIDTETTGLGGAGVYCFMIGIGTFEAYGGQETGYGIRDMESSLLPPAPTPLRPYGPTSVPTHFVVRQFFMRHPGEEGAQLMAVADLLERYEMSVTFNGRTFDLPLLRARFDQNRRSFPDLRGSAGLLHPDRPHLDLLHPARRLWKKRLQSCRLINLEQMILGMTRSEEDVPGHLIPQLYTEYTRSGQAGAMRRVFYHNLEDIVSMVALAEQLGRAFDEPASLPDAPLHAQDWLALGQCYEKLAQWARAEAAYQSALERLRDPAVQADAFGRLAQLYRRQERWTEAAEIWQRWLSSVPGNDPTPYIELAKYCEWQINDLEQAAMWTAWALHNLRTTATPSWMKGHVAELEHRLQRLQKKQGQK